MLLQMRVVVVAELEEGQKFRLDAYTQVVNAHGGLLEMSMKVSKGQKLLLAIPTMGAQQSCKVVTAKGTQDGFFAVAFEFDSPTPRFWPLTFPPPDWCLVKAEN